MNNIVLVHGGFVDGSGWESVYQTLKEDGYNVSIVQNPTIPLEDDVAVTRRMLAGQDGPAIRGRRGRGRSRVHGRLPSPMGRGGSRRQDQRTGMEGQAELVPDRCRRQDDSS